ncbi:MAG: transposase [Ruminococcus sp.]|nr:transposase [Ruminococcus sp.]
MDLTDSQWKKIEKYFPSGNKSHYHKRSLVETVLYKIGCQWSMLLHDYPSHNTVWSFYHRAKQNGTWDRFADNL